MALILIVIALASLFFAAFPTILPASPRFSFGWLGVFLLAFVAYVLPHLL